MTCPACGAETPFTFRVPDGTGQRVACEACRDGIPGAAPEPEGAQGISDEFWKEQQRYEGGYCE